MTAYIEVLTEGVSDVPLIKELLERKFSLQENNHFKIHPHRGRGRIPDNILAQPDIKHQGLLDQLPAKLRGFSWLPENSMVLVLIDADNDDPQDLVIQLDNMLNSLPRKPPRVLFRIAVEETESWFIADVNAVKQAFPAARIKKIKEIRPDAVVGAWERLAECVGLDCQSVSGADKYEWAIKISPHMNFENSISPSFNNLITGLDNYLQEAG